ncbi:MAG: hypothetical protein GXO93_03835 [FCB group bacterium]|nr:hypothetical protein [FCB group bacterium]
MNYSKIVNRSIEIAWRYKTLWVFGIFAGGGLPLLNFDYNDFNSSSWSADTFNSFSNISNELIVLLIAGFMVFGLAFFFMYLVSQGALIDAVNKIERGGVYKFSTSFSAGLKFFWRFLGISVLAIAILVTLVLFVVLICYLFFKIHIALGIISILILMPVAIFVFFLFYNVFSLAQRAVVLRDTSIGNALEEGYHLFKNHLQQNVIIFLVFVGFSIGIGILILILSLLLAIPLIALVIASQHSLIFLIILGLFIGLPVSIVVGGFLGVFYSNLYTLFYIELVEPKQSTLPPNPAGATGLA